MCKDVLHSDGIYHVARKKRGAVGNARDFFRTFGQMLARNCTDKVHAALRACGQHRGEDEAYRACMRDAGLADQASRCTRGHSATCIVAGDTRVYHACVSEPGEQTVYGTPLFGAPSRVVKAPEQSQ